jgi:tRNA G18 (ribose-2'-O)-methylase SpoU
MTGEAGHPDATGTGLPGDLFIAEGDKVVAQLISSPHETLSVMVSAHRLEHHRPFLAGLDPETPVFVVGREIIDGVAGFAIHRGLLALGRRVDPGDALELARSSGVVIVLEDLTNHDNVGAVFRNARALATPVPGKAHPACVLLTPRCCDPLYRKSLRVSMGNALHVPFATIEDWPSGLGALAAAGCEPLAMALTEDADDLATLRPDPDRVPMLIMGTEGPGLSSKTLDAVRSGGGRVTRIDIEPEADSLNVSVACAVALHRLRSRAVARTG